MKKRKQSGFILIFFILSISITFLTWISLSSSNVFEYIDLKSDFKNNRDYLNNNILCADQFVNIFIKSRYNLNIIDKKYFFTRNLFLDDDYLCTIKDIDIFYVNNKINRIFFIIDDFAFEYKFENGFVNFRKSFNLFEYE